MRLSRFQIYLLEVICIVLIISAVSFLFPQYFGIYFDDKNYWDFHGVFLLFFLATFPRLTLLFSSIAFGGFFWWVGWFFAPRILVATLATLSYWHSNPVLVVMAWLIAIGGEATEKMVVVKRARTRVQYRTKADNQGEVIDIQRID